MKSTAPAVESITLEDMLWVIKNSDYTEEEYFKLIVQCQMNIREKR
jgi:hypothetical protein